MRIIIYLALQLGISHAVSPQYGILANETLSLFNFALDKYLELGYPYDEISPISCQPIKPDLDVFNIGHNDVLGPIGLTLFDSMDTLAIMGDKDKFHIAVRKIIEHFDQLNFDQIDSIVQVFEINIRVLGGLLSSHLYLVDPRSHLQMDGYDNELLKLAYDMGKRLILSFDTESLIKYQLGDLGLGVMYNYPRINLKYGHKAVPKRLQYSQCLSGMTTFGLEMSLLSKLTGDEIFTQVIKESIRSVWNNRSKLDLVPMSFNTLSGQFDNAITGVGASIDSFYEYLLKYSILFDDDELMSYWHRSLSSLQANSLEFSTGIFHNVDFTTGERVTEWIDSLSVFFPGLLVLDGQWDIAIKMVLSYLSIWNHYDGIPERWNYHPLRSQGLFNGPYKRGDFIEGFDKDTTNEILLKNSIGLEWYPLRPELIESVYYLYTVTKDPLMLQIGKTIMEKLKESMFDCGFAGIQNVQTGELNDRMESFVLSETLKYLYLLFSYADEGQESDILKNAVFTTEGHPFWWNKQIVQYHRQHPLNLKQMNEIKPDVKTTGWSFTRKKSFNLNKEFQIFKDTFHASLQKVLHVDRVSPWVEKALSLDPAKFNAGSLVPTDEGGHQMIQDIDKHHFDELRAYLLTRYNITIQNPEVPRHQCPKYPRDTTEIFSSIMHHYDVYALERQNPMTLRKVPHHKKQVELQSPFYDNYIDRKRAFCPVPPLETRLRITGEYATTEAYTLQTGGTYIHSMSGADILLVEENGKHKLLLLNGVAVAQPILLNSEKLMPDSIENHLLKLDDILISNVRVI